MTIRLLALGALCAGGLFCASSAPTVAQGIVLNLPWAKGDNIQRNRDGGRMGSSDIGAYESQRKKREAIRDGGRVQRGSKVKTNQGTGGGNIDVIQSGARIRF
jgi:hypothetical protein